MTPGVVIAINPSPEQIAKLDEGMRAWEMRAARGECSWICADCSMTFRDGMPDKCEHGHQGCTDLIIRDKKEAGCV